MDGNNHVIDATDPFVVITEQLKRFQHPVASECCIYRVPYQLRRLDEAAYIPKIVSIGPLHHGNNDLKRMEEKKIRCLSYFLQRYNVDLRCCVEIVKEQVGRLRSCYEEALEFTDEQLVQIILVDAVFVISFLLWSGNDEFNNCCKVSFLDVDSELILLENQLPFFILEDLFDFASKGSDDISLIERFYIFFTGCSFIEEKREYLKKIAEEEYNPEHLVDLLRKFYVPLNPHEGKALTTIHNPSVTELHQAGAKLVVESSSDLFDISFTNGILKIPKFLIQVPTCSMLRNLIAFEQCHQRKGYYISNYTRMLDFLINTPEDVNLLAENEIIINWLGDSSEVSTMINKLGDGVLTQTDEYYFADVCNKLESYYRSRWHRWKAILKQNYFNTPWAIISVTAAVLLLILTITQTACSIISTINGD